MTGRNVPWGPDEGCRRDHWLDAHAVPATGKDRYRCRACEKFRALYRGSGHSRIDPDPVIVDRLVRGEADRPPLIHPLERRQAVQRLMDQGVSVSETAERVGTTERTVWRIRSKIKRGVPYGVRA
jgi:transposase-like protein